MCCRDADGIAATVFDVRIADDPCRYALTSVVAGVVPIEFHRGLEYRIWQIADLDQPITIVAGAPEATWLDRASELVGTLVVDADG